MEAFLKRLSGTRKKPKFEVILCLSFNNYKKEDQEDEASAMGERRVGMGLLSLSYSFFLRKQ